jgi:D-sedoheptulose 7-phosphate isomerase
MVLAKEAETSAMTQPVSDRLTEPFRDQALRECGESMQTKHDFFSKYAESPDEISRLLAARLEQGGRLFAIGMGGSLCDALHIAGEFNHPIIEKRLVFPVVPLRTDIATMTVIGNELDFTRVFVNQLRLQTTPNNIVMSQRSRLLRK